MINHLGSTKKSTWWWIYFAFQLFVWIFELFTGGHAPVDLLLSAFFGIGLVGFWGYLRGVSIGPRVLWPIYFCLLVAAAAYGAGSALLRAAHSDAAFIVPLLLVVVVLTYPLWLALWRYAFRSNDIWRASRIAP